LAIRAFAPIGGLLLALSGVVHAGTPTLPTIPATNFVITDFGAIGDGLTNNATMIQNAITAATAAGGGTVEIPANGTLSTYLCGPISLSNSINLQIDFGAMLQMLPRNVTTNGSVIIPKWPSASTPFISGATLHDVEISGTGTIDGQGTNWWFPKASTRPNFIQFTHSTNVLIQAVTLQNPPTFHIMVHNSNFGLTIQNIIINTPGDSPNTDGIDLASTNVLIQGCFISDGDDNIQLGSSAAAAVDITITNCTFGAGHGLSLGSGTQLGVQNMIVSNCTFNGTRYGIHMKSDRGIGGLSQNLQYLDITMTNVAYPIALYSYYNEIGAPSTINVSPFMASTDTVHAVTSTTPIWNNIIISNLTATANTGKNVSGILWGLPEMLVSNVTLYNVNITVTNTTFDIYNATGIQIINSQLTAPGATTNTLTLFNAQVTITNTTPNPNPVTLGGLATTQGPNTLAFFSAQAAVTDSNMLGTGSMTLGDSTFTFAQDSVSSANNFAILDSDTLTVSSGTNFLSGALSGGGMLTLNLLANSLLTLQADSSAFDGAVTVSSGTLLVDNTTGTGTGTGAVSVDSGATLGGHGVIGGPVTIANGAQFSPGGSVGTLTISNTLALGSTSVLQYQLGASNDLAVVSGNLTLGGTINVSDAGGFTNGTFTLFRYGGTLATNGGPAILTIGTVPNTNLLYAVDISSNGFVNLIVTVPTEASFTASPTNGFAPLTVTFTDTSSGTITNRFWDFGDATTTNTLATTVNHTYETNCTYTVQLIVSGPIGVSTNSQVDYIIVAAPCNFPLSATNASFGDLGGNGTVTVTPYTNVCAWTASSNDSWILITGGSVSATGSAVVAYSVLPNTTTMSSRTGTMTVAGQAFTVIQSGDNTPPTVVLTAPTSGIVSNTITISATATDDVAVVQVEFYRDNTVLLGTVATPPYSVIFDTTKIPDGSHCFSAKASDPAGNVGTSAADCVNVNNNPPTTPTGLTATGISTTQISLSWTASTDAGSGVAFYTVYRDGTQVAATSGTTYTDTGLTLGTEHCYTVAATDNGQRMSPPSAQACGQTFTTVAALVGTYNGLVIQTNAPSFASSGPFKLVLSQTGSFAATMKLGTVHISFKGQLDDSGNFAGTVSAGGLGTLPVTLHLDLAGSNQITGTISGGTFTSQLLAGQAVFSRVNPCPLAGTYTAVFQPSTNDDLNVPQGFGYGTLTVTTAGNGHITGYLGDGTMVSATAPLSKQGLWPLYAALYRGNGAAIGWVTVVTNGLVDATVDWFRPSIPTSSFYPAGFNTVATLDGNKYVRRPSSSPSFSGNGQLTLGGGNLGADIVQDVYIDPKGNVSFAFVNNENVQMRLNTTTGQFSGSFTHPTLNETITFKGLVLQIDKNGAGYFVGSSETGFAVIQLLP